MPDLPFRARKTLRSAINGANPRGSRAPGCVAVELHAATISVQPKLAVSLPQKRTPGGLCSGCVEFVASRVQASELDGGVSGDEGCRLVRPVNRCPYGTESFLRSP